MIEARDEITITGTIEHIFYYNEENGYAVFKLVGDDEVTCTGNFIALEEGMYVSVTGVETNHPKYGFQFKVNYLEEKEPEDLISIEKYLASGAIKGVGPKLANSIVKKFDKDALRIIEEEPERLVEIRGISERKARDIYMQVEKTRGQRRAMMFLQKYKISNKLSLKIYEKYKDQLFEVLKNNPYKLIEDIDGVGFKKADTIAINMGFEETSEFRISYCIIDTLKNASKEGNMFLPRNVLLEKVAFLLGFNIENIDDILSNMAIDRKIVLKELDLKGDGKATLVVYFAPYYYIELNTAYLLGELNGTNKVDEKLLLKRITEFEKRQDIKLDELQIKGVIEATKNNIFILTGGPGTGKTTTIQAIINMFEQEGMDIMLCAPTGRAARRMTQATGHIAKTIHRLLEVQVGKSDDEFSGIRFGKNEDDPLETDVVIVDEMSMVDINLLNSLLLAISKGTHIIFIGDTSQLPSVGPGSVLKDMIASGVFKSLKLTRIFRQSSTSDIVINAHKIDNGENIEFDNNSKDFFFIRQSKPISIRENLKTLISEKLPSYTGAKPLDIQVLVPTRKGHLGVEELNFALQEYLNPHSRDKSEYKGYKYTFREGDKVMQIRNNYQLSWEIEGKNSIVVEEGMGIFNGDMGKIIRVDNFYEEVTVLFEDDRKVVYPFMGLDELELAYALTIHKSQGSEYPVVIIPLLNVPPLLRHRNLIYTGITRAKTHVILMGSKEIFMEMVKNDKEQERYSALKYYIIQNKKASEKST